MYKTTSTRIENASYTRSLDMENILITQEAEQLCPSVNMLYIIRYFMVRSCIAITCRRLTVYEQIVPTFFPHVERIRLNIVSRERCVVSACSVVLLI